MTDNSTQQTGSDDGANQGQNTGLNCGSCLYSIIGLFVLGAIIVPTVVSLIPASPTQLTDDEKKLQTIVHELVPLQEECFKAGEFKGPVVGKCVVWWVDEDRPSAAHAMIPATAQGTSGDSELTFFLVSELNYTPGYGKVRNQVDIAVVYWPDKKPAGFVSLARDSGTAGIPHARAQGQESNIVPVISSWITELLENG